MDHADVCDPCDGSDGIVFDSMRLSQLGRAVVGEQTVQEFCQKTSLSRSLVSRLLNGTLKAPPTIRSIYRFAGENGQIVDEMLNAGGYPTGAIAHMKKMPNLLREANKEFPVLSALHLVESNASGLTLTLNTLVRQEYGEQFQIDYRIDGTFAIRQVAGYTLVGIPAFCSDETYSDDVWRQALRALAQALTRWNDSDVCYCIFTNSSQIYSKLKITPNLDYKLAALITTDGRFFQSQHVIAPYGASEEEKDDYVKNFPVWLVPISDSSL